MIDIRLFCEHLYAAFYIPVYLYDNKVLLSSYPEQKQDTFPPPIYLSQLWESDEPASYT